MDKTSVLKSNINLINYAKSISGKFNFIIKPLLTNLPFSHFIYWKLLKSGHYLVLSNNLQIIQAYLEHKLSNDNRGFLEKFNNTKKYLWQPHLVNELPGLSLCHELNIWHGMRVSYESKDCLESFVFAAPIECEQVTDIYLNHYYILERFIVYFKAEFEKLVNLIDKSILPLSGFYKEEFSKISQINPGFLKERFFRNTEVDKFYLEKYPQTYLTKKETECLYYLCLGKSAKQISSILNISSRTIEKHFENIKMKCNLNFLDQIVNLCYESGIDKLHLEKYSNAVIIKS